MQDLQDLKNRFEIIGNSDALNYALTTAEKVAHTDLTVLINGESGTGKEAFSKVIHQLSRRKSNPFIAINCGAIPEGTIDSELFGHEKGSFTGANDKRKGYFETVNKGTIFLDEIGEMPLGTQARLLRLLQNGEYMKVGSSTIEKVDVRVIAATNVNLLEKVQQGKFREDLFYRLNTVPIEVPPLRNRGFDIIMLFKKFSIDFSEKNKMPRVKLSEEAEQLLMSYRWPGNVRQLKNVAEQINLMLQGDTIYPEDLKRFLPITSSSMQSVNLQNDPFEQGITNEFLLKMLIEMRQDISDIKRAFFQITQNNFSKNDVSDFSKPNSVQPLAIEMPTSPYKNQVEEVSKVYEIEHKKPNYHIEEHVNLNLADMEKKLIIKALEKHNAKRKNAAHELGISERTLYRKIIDYDIIIKPV
jgi:DNA-binding NtrC family response regulator